MAVTEADFAFGEVWTRPTMSLRCLAVGLPGACFPESGVRTQEVASITYAMLQEYAPFPPQLELVVAPLFCSEFDALEMIKFLGDQGYRGALRIVAPKLPNRAIVLRELRTHAVKQGITLEMIEGG